MNPADFSAVAHWCQSYLELQYSADVGQRFGRLLEVLAKIANLPRDGVDRFDWLKTKEEEVNAELRALVRAFADFQQQQELAARIRSGRWRDEAASRLFVYGTLKRGFRRSSALAGQQFLGTARTLPQYRIFDCGGYPGLVEDPKGVAIEGELWQVTAEGLAVLDEIEGVDLKLYERRVIQLDEPFRNEAAQSYFYCRAVQGMKDCGTCWTEK